MTITYEAGKIKTSTDALGNVTTMEYNNLGMLKSITDRMGNKTSYEYDSLGNKTSQTESNGAKTAYTYDSRGQVLTQTDERGNTSIFKYDGNGNLIEATDEYGNKITYQYDGEDRVLKEIDSAGNTTEKTYDAAGREVTAQDDLGVVTTREFDKDGTVKSLTTTGKGTIYYEYYKNGKLKNITDPKGNKTKYYYDSSWNLSRVEDANGNATTYTYDVSGNVLTATDPLGGRIENTYDSKGNLLTEKDPNGNVTTYEYNANGKLTHVKDALENTTIYEYDKEDRVIKITNSRGYSKTFAYNSSGFVSSVIDELGNTANVEYDISGNVISKKDAYGVEVEKNAYDAHGNLLTMTDALGNVATNKYDKLGELCESINKMNQSTNYEYDKIGRLVKVSDPLKGLSTKTYYDDGNVKTITDPNGNSSSFDYDELGKLIKETTPIGSSKTYGYNAIGLLEKATNGRNQETTYIYDKAGRITSYTDAEGTVSYGYDKNSNVTSVTDKNGTITRVYDALNRVSEYTDFRGNTVKYAYDTCGNLIALTYPGGKIVRYTYNRANNLTEVTDWSNHITKYEYDKNGRLIKTIRPNGTLMEVTYDVAGQVKEQKETDAYGEIISQFDYQYDANGNVTSEESSSENGVYKGTTAVMTYGVGNKLLTYNGQTIEYDADGNMTYGVLNGKMVHFEYDCRNRLVKAGDTEYQYDAENNRTAVIENGKKTEYVYNPNTSLSEMLIKVDSDGNKTYYVYGLGLIGEESNSEYLTYHFDRRGSTIAITNMDSLITDRFQYGAYGEVTGHSGNTQTPFMYNGRDGVVTDSNGLYYMRARYYNPDIKRFINQDVVIGNVTDGRSLNRYAYVYGNPVDSTDPFGLSPEITASGIGHTILDIFGLVPVFGEVFDAINSLWYAAEGDFVNAALSVAATAPFLGMAATGAKWGSKIFKSIKASGRVTDIISTGMKYTKKVVVRADNVISSAKRVVRSKIDNVYQGAKTLTKKGSKADFGACFVAGTKIITEEGNKSIEEIKIGDKVLSQNIYTGEKEYKEVTNLYVKEVDTLVHLDIEGTKIDTTINHPFWVIDQGWTGAGDLKVGDKVLLSSGKIARVSHTYIEKLSKPVKVYNFEVADWHTYFVSDAGVLVHNMCSMPITTNTKTFYQVTSKEDAAKIMINGNLTGKEFKEVYAWTVQPTLKQAKGSGARSIETVISFDANPNLFVKDETVAENIQDIARVSTRPAPISVSNIQEVGFKKEWWKFWKK